MRIHLVTYATPRFRLRQWILGWSAKVNHVVDTVTHWTPEKLLKAGFEDRCKDIKLTERGSGFWAWKPFIIQKKLVEVAVGDVVFYCDVGRRYPYKQLNCTITRYLDWMSLNLQEIMPGLYIPWKGPMAQWTKRDAFVAAGMDREEIHQAPPLQASFSVWRNTPISNRVVSEWMELASKRALISDDASLCGMPELPQYHDHRHDQSLLTLVCLRNGIKGISVGEAMPQLDTQHPSEIAALAFGCLPQKTTISSRLLEIVCIGLAKIEMQMRKKIKFAQPMADPN